MEKLKVFLSSTMTELHNERMAVHNALAERGMEVIWFEGFGARPEAAQTAYLEGVQEADVYIGIFWNQYSPATEEEYREADRLGKPRFIYIKDFAVDREQALQKLIGELGQKHTYKTFSDALTLAHQVERDIQDWILHQWRKTKEELLRAEVRLGGFEVEKKVTDELIEEKAQTKTQVIVLRESLERLEQSLLEQAPLKVDDRDLLKDRYRISEVIASTGLSTVYKAYDIKAQAECIIKRIDVQVPSEIAVPVDFRFDHENIASTVTFWHELDSVFIVLEFYEGWSLDQLLEINPTGFGEGWVETWTTQLMRALVYLHGLRPSIVHRDIKPSNILVRKSDKSVVVLDWVSAIFHKRGTLQVPLGTEGYAPPEQFRGLAEPRSDIYALGAFIHSLLFGKPPPSAGARIHGAQLDKRLGSFFAGRYALRMLSLNIDDRFPSTEEMLKQWEKDRKATRMLPDWELFWKCTFPNSAS
ncbi:MAG: DUF4062 domain-containing protein [Anaerolineales bacterium]|nr:DUF4062 domain-containing protein [Anaerolineales bacterium]